MKIDEPLEQADSNELESQAKFRVLAGNQKNASARGALLIKKVCFLIKGGCNSPVEVGIVVGVLSLPSMRFSLVRGEESKSRSVQYSASMKNRPLGGSRKDRWPGLEELLDCL